MRCDIETACSNVGSFLFERFLRSSEVRGRNTAIVARQAGKNLANGEALTDSEGIEKVRKRKGRVFDEKRLREGWG